MSHSIVQNLASVITNAFVGRLAADSSNIVQLIRDTYNVSSLYKITSECVYKCVCVCVCACVRACMRACVIRVWLYYM